MKIYPKHNNDSGMALISVLMLMMTVSLLVMAMVGYSQLANFNTRSDADYLRSSYVAEGALNRIMWLIAADNYVNNTSDLSSFDYSEYDEERYLPDTVDRELDYYGTTVKYRIANGAGGLSVERSLSTALRNVTSSRRTMEEDLADAITIFETRYNDYTDSDDLAGDDGMEVNEYEEAGIPSLPRNGVLQYREELWWIPDGIKFFPPDINGRLSWVNPFGIGTQRNSRMDLFQVNYAVLTNQANLESDDARSVLTALKKYRKERIILSEELDPLLWDTLRRNFTMTNSGCYRVIIENATSGQGSSARLDATFFDPGIEDDENKNIIFYDFLRY